MLIDLQYSNSFNWYVAAASVVIDAAALSIQAISQLLITDANLKIDMELLAKNPYNFYYWKTKTLTSLISGMALGLINLILLCLIGLSTDIFLRSLIMLPLACLFGTILGFTGWSFSWQMKNPYFFSNLFISIITIVSGVLVLISQYPRWLMILSYGFPFFEVVNFIKIKDGNFYLSCLIALAWIILGIISYIVQIKSVLNKKIHQY